MSALPTDYVARRQPGAWLQVTIPLRTVSENNAREHHMARARRRARQRNTVGLVMCGQLQRHGVTAPCSREDAPGTRRGVRMLPEAVRVVLTRLAPSSGLDGDNLQGALKAVRDGVADALGVDDRSPRVEWAYAQRRSERGVWTVEIRVEVVR